LDPAAILPVKLSGTGQGYADLREVSAGELRGTTFDEYFYSADVRLGRGETGRYNIPKVGVFLWRLRAYPLEAVRPFEVAPGRFAFDPSGREIPLFAAGEQRQAVGWKTPEEHEVPGPIRCRLLAERMPGLYADTEHPRSLAVMVDGALLPRGDVGAANLADWTRTAPTKSVHRSSAAS
jgi:hypothetical protein